MNNSRSSSSYLFLILILLLFLLRIFFMFKTNLLVEEAYYWNYSNHLDFSFLDHPPMVAVLIKLGTLIFGVNEWGVRFASVPCWIITCYFSFKLTTLIRKEAGLYAVVLLSIMPFFFIHSLIITPDIPLILSWSATLYYLYQALVLDRDKSWYWAGVWLGLGLLSKYTIVLLGLSTIIYLIGDPASRKWFLRKEPYCCALIAFIIFIPVIYWNATHDWASFLFQSSRRFHDYYSFSFHELIGLVLVFLTPTGILGAWILFSQNYSKKFIAIKTKYFFQIYVIVPLLFFSLFSLFHGIRVNWIGPIFLAIIPWFALLITDNQQIIGVTFRKGWAITSVIIVFIYSSIIYCILSDKPEKMSHFLFEKVIPWNNFTREVYNIAQQLENKTHNTPIILPLDTYNIASELAFYQKKYFKQGQINTPYKVIGSHVFGLNSLMYKYWGNMEEIKGKTLILVSPKISFFSYPLVKQKIVPLSNIKPVNYHDDNGHKSLIFYYQIVKLT
ncbi:dolichyl-phosphate mannosyltransferase [Legionella gratiana]|uniref:Dolichyl-phosphate mannosyltransferase n=1 Tax=Legionella gratiana TaxID=45066 RepID=A0A378J6I4_9GAMM|nr:glycosyltransferase family 39 protein [Legionella gratiana]KTD06165.1 dolichyl-phosphate mannosyltransferase [Legionella gratiana]STX42996.1 dolichyl-phosphate mannosyltransferase [Legionella gratiana]